ncbi:N(alpha)-acetyltransferase 38, NatC auxiliary [Polyrhizophydium stewartii]|uniref:N(Alpha)-acetyltransferase 38, NatC auxiliary n=1 Tax=Polyrhizophydium stewartii TaxID=2732419 RepID=A0ABR4N8X3_9FUNG
MDEQPALVAAAEGLGLAADGSETGSKERLKALLNRKARVTTTDGRVFVGFFVCLDNSGSMILSATEEFPPSGCRCSPLRFTILHRLTHGTVILTWAEMETY